MTTKYKAALKLSTLTPDALVTKGKNNIQLMQTSPYFSSTTWPIPLASGSTALDDLHLSILATATNTPGAISNMHEKQRVVLSIFNVFRPFVEMVANNTTDAKTVIESVGMVAIAPNGNTPVTELTLEAIGNGSVQISVPRGQGEAAFIYQYSTDGGNNWLEVDCSKLATVTLKNQTPASVLHFRYAPVSKTKGAFSQSKSVIVL